MTNTAIECDAGADGVPAPAPAGLEDLLRERGLVQILAEGMPDLIYVKDAQCRYVFNNASHLRFLGARTPDDVRGKTVLDVFPGELAEKFYRDERAVIETGRALVNEVEQTADSQGRRVWVSTTKVPIRDEWGAVVGLAGISRDITDRKGAQDESQRAHAALRSEHAQLVQALERLEAANEELAATQLQLAEVTKQQTLGALAAGIAHEVKNPLAMMGVGLDFLAERVDSRDEAVETAFKGMRAALDHARGVVQGLLDLARPGRLERAPLAVRVPIERVLLLTRSEMLRRHVKARSHVAADLPPINADCTKVQQVLLNVVGNALQAMAGGGTLEVGAAVGRWAGPPQGELAPGDAAVVVTIDDTGPGIPADRLPRLFEPFHTTKPRGEGTGLGLSVARNIMNLHGGAIGIQNRPEGGLRVTLTFKEGVASHEHETGTGR